MNTKAFFLSTSARSRSRGLLIACLVAGASGLAASRADDEPSRLGALLGRPAESAPDGGSAGTVMNWWSIPRTARTAAKHLAASQDASVTRCVAIEHDGVVSYEFHAGRRLGLFRKTDFVLTSVSEPKATADKNRAERTLKNQIKRRMERIRAAAWDPPSTTYAVPARNSSSKSQ